MTPSYSSLRPIRIILVDDHSILRGGLASMLDGQDGFDVVGSFGSVGEALATKNRDPDVIVQDISMPGIGGLEALGMYKERFPKAHVLMLSMHPAPTFGLRAIRAGALGYINKTAAPDELIAAVQKVSKGKRVIPPDLAEALLDQSISTSERPPHEDLSDREYIVFRRLCAGARVVEIAEELALSAKTVSTYRRRILDKMGMQSTTELVRYAVEHDLLGG
jgi:two-component system invasion response regulator UvrY